MKTDNSSVLVKLWQIKGIFIFTEFWWIHGQIPKQFYMANSITWIRHLFYIIVALMVISVLTKGTLLSKLTLISANKCCNLCHVYSTSPRPWPTAIHCQHMFETRSRLMGKFIISVLQLSPRSMKKKITKFNFNISDIFDWEILNLKINNGTTKKYVYKQHV